MLARATKKELIGFYYFLPTILLLGALFFYPLINSVYLSFHKQALYEAVPTFVGLGNYLEWFASVRFWASLKRTFIWTGGIVGMQMVVGLGAALLLNREFKGRAFARTAVLLPYFVPSVIACLVFRWMYNDINGLFNYVLISLGIIRSPILWLGEKSIVMFSVMMAGLWRFSPFATINILARLQTIPPRFYDAAKVDGANRLQTFVYITLPQIRGVLLIVLLLRLIFMFNNFDVIWIMTGGGPARATETLPVLAYKTAFGTMQLGRASTITTLLLLILVGIMIIYFMVFQPNKERLT